MASTEEQIKKMAESYERDGFGVVRGFFTDAEVEELRNEVTRLIKEDSKTKTNNLNIHSDDSNRKSRHFLESGDQMYYFFEEKAVDQQTKELQVEKEKSLAKIGHALHAHNDIFKKATMHQRAKDVFKAIGFKEPTVMQSMFIFKNPKVGGEYFPHQDASYLYAEPCTHVAGIWIALDDATAENGCLEFIPGSHKWPVSRRFVRTGNTKEGEKLFEWTAPLEEFDDTQFVAAPAKRGDMVLIHGRVVHRSAANTSDKSRWIYTFHAYDRARSEYSKENWLQPVVTNSFMPLYSAA